MKGLELSKRYFETYGISMLRSLKETYPELDGQFAAGLVGQGSECLGFDDQLSTDHDFGPSFCIWLTQPVYEKYADVRISEDGLNVEETVELLVNKLQNLNNN